MKNKQSESNWFLYSFGFFIILAGVIFALFNGGYSTQSSKQNILPSAEFQGHERSVVWVTFSPDGKALATAGADGKVIVWDLLTRKKRFCLDGFPDTVWFAIYSTTGFELVTGSHQGSLIVWNAETGKKLRTLRGHVGTVVTGAFSPNGRFLATGCTEHLVKIWNTATWDEYATIQDHQSSIKNVQFSDDSTMLASSSDDKLVRIWDVIQKKAILSFGDIGEDSWTYAWSLAFIPKSNLLATGSEDQKVILWDVGTGNKVRVFEGHKHRVYSVISSPDGSVVLSGSKDGIVKVWDVELRKESFSLLMGAPVHSLAFSKDGKTLAVASGASVFLYDEQFLSQMGVGKGNQKSEK